MSEILKGMTREEALGKLCEFSDEPGNYALVHNGKLYGCPCDLGIAPKDCPNTFKCAQCGVCLSTAINAYYDEQDKPRWVELVRLFAQGVRCAGAEAFYADNLNGELAAEIARTNARRKIEAFISQNGGFNDGLEDVTGAGWGIYWSGTAFITDVFEYAGAGEITCATRSLAEAVIERYGDELRSLAGVK
jgi:hypothetical protein